eukprot:1103754_1
MQVVILIVMESTQTASALVPSWYGHIMTHIIRNPLSVRVCVTPLPFLVVLMIILKHLLSHNINTNKSYAMTTNHVLSNVSLLRDVETLQFDAQPMRDVISSAQAHNLVKSPPSSVLLVLNAMCCAVEAVVLHVIAHIYAYSHIRIDSISCHIDCRADNTDQECFGMTAVMRFPDGMYSQYVSCDNQCDTIKYQYYPTMPPTSAPTSAPSSTPTSLPTENPSCAPTSASTVFPSAFPTLNPTLSPTHNPSAAPSTNPTLNPSSVTLNPTVSPTHHPSDTPSINPTSSPTFAPTSSPFTTIEVRVFEITLKGDAIGQLEDAEVESIVANSVLCITE